MPHWLLANIDADRVEGALYSGFGGLNFASTPLRVCERVVYHVQKYVHQLHELIENGRVTLRPDFEWLLCDKPWEGPGAPQTWDAIRRLCSEGPKAGHSPDLTSNAAPPVCRRNAPITSSRDCELLLWQTSGLDPAP